ncbi:hypothetical protein ABZ208_35300 [Streptomyces sp. NPDC006208]|uniref:hypothetical protein n=1 Tax=Streptomyces sp. NPDC006208 TaxID=3156734 RepID=UPI0033BE5F10
MPLPAGVETVTVTAGEPLSLPNGAALQGRLTFTGPDLVTIAGDDVILGGAAEVPLIDGEFTVTLCATDATGMSPSGWTYKVTAKLTNGPDWVRHISLPKAVPSVALADVVVPNPVAGEFTTLAVPRGGVTLATDGTPAPALGIEGDWALDTGARRLYGPRGASSWPAFSVVPAPTEAGWTRNGFAELLGGDLYLTEAGDGFGAGSSWYSTLVTTEGLDVSFACEMSGGTGADGVCIAFADPGAADSFVGGGGGDLGLVGCNSVALALDTGGGSRARLVQTTPTTMTALQTYGGALTLRPAPFTARLRYLDGVLTAWVNEVQILQHTIALPATARLGFTGSNGGLTDDHIVRGVLVVPRGGMLL